MPGYSYCPASQDSPCPTPSPPRLVFVDVLPQPSDTCTESAQMPGCHCLYLSILGSEDYHPLKVKITCLIGLSPLAYIMQEDSNSMNHIEFTSRNITCQFRCLREYGNIYDETWHRV